MTPHDADLSQIADALARLAADPALGSAAGARVALDAGSLSVIEADEAGRSLLAGALPPALIGRLIQFGSGLAPVSGVRIERLTWSLAPGTQPRLTACRRVRRQDGSLVLLLAVAGEAGSAGEVPAAPWPAVLPLPAEHQAARTAPVQEALVTVAPLTDSTSGSPAALVVNGERADHTAHDTAGDVADDRAGSVAVPSPAASSGSGSAAAAPAPEFIAPTAEPNAVVPPVVAFPWPVMPPPVAPPSAVPPSTLPPPVPPVPMTEAATTAAPVNVAPPMPPEPLPGVSPEAAGAEPDAPLPLPDKLRLLWEIDPTGVVSRLSPEAELALGAEAIGDMIGRPWSDLSGTHILDAGGIVAAAIAQRRTFSGVPTLWRIGNTAEGYRVALSGLAATDAARRYAGFRGFGIISTRQREAFPLPSPEAVSDDNPADHPAEALPTPVVEPVSTTPEEPVQHAPGLMAAPAPTPQDDESLPETEAGPLPDVAGMATSEPEGTVGEAPAYALADQPETAAGSNIVPITPDVTPPLVGEKPVLSRNERSAFREIARALGARIEGETTATSEAGQPADPVPVPAGTAPVDETPPAAAPSDAASPEPDGTESSNAADLVASMRDRLAEQARERTGEVIRFAPPQRARDDAFADLIDKLPIGVLVMREERIVHANRTLIDLLDYADLDQLTAAGAQALFAAPAPDEGGGVLALRRNDGGLETVDARLSAISWNGEPATLMSFRRAVETAEPPRLAALKLDLDKAKAQGTELSAILDTATDGVVTLDDRGRILSLNKSAEALFGYDQREVIGENLTLLLAPETHITALDYLDGLKGGGVASLMNDGREVQGRVRQGGRIPLFMTMGRISDAPERKFAAVLRDMTAWKKAEAELIEARRAAERASAQKSDVLAKISHEIRTPLNAIIGFTEVMSEERFGPIGNERYKEYLRDIHDSGGYVISLVNDLLDLAKIEAGKMDLSFTAVSLNDLAANAVALLQPEANRQRVVLRSGLQPKLPSLVADERSLRQIVLNVLSNAVKFTDAGGQVILSTALSDRGEVILRVRDTGIGMTDKELEQALEPFRQVSATRRGTGTGLGLPITKALVEANKGALRITSARGEGTLVEIAFPPQRVLAS